MAGERYTEQISAFNSNYNLNYDIKGEFEIHTKLGAIEDFTFASSPQRKNQKAYLKTLNNTIKAYLEEKTKMQAGKEYDLSDVSIKGFISEFDKVINAILTDAAPEDKPYEHTPFAGASESFMAANAWNAVKQFNKPLHEIWADQIRKGTLTLDDLQTYTKSAATMLDRMVHNNMQYTDVAKKDLATVVMAKKTMEEAINKRSWTSWLNPLNWGPNRRENARLEELNAKLASYRTAGFPVDGVVPQEYGSNMLGKALAELQKAYGAKKTAQTAATTAKQEKKTVNNTKKTEEKKPTVEQKKSEPKIKLSNMNEALARCNDKKVQEYLKAEIEGIFANVNHQFKKLAIDAILSTMPDQTKGHWYPFQSKSTEMAKERSIEENARFSPASFNIVALLVTNSMKPEEKIVALQKVSNLFMHNFSPALSDSKYHKYLDNYFVQNASLKEIESLIGKSQDVDKIMENVCRELGVEKTKVYLPELSEGKDNLEKADKVEEIEPYCKEKTVD